MEILDKLTILADAAKYDVSCSSSGSSRKNKEGGIGNAAISGICHSWSDDGRCISLLKILLTNYCIYNCAYCVNRSSNDLPRAAFTPDEVAQLTINFYRRNYIEGLFLSSAIMKDPNHTMELLLTTVKLLRNEHRFNGYIHVKAIPGADSRLIYETGKYVDRMSVNIELPSSGGLKLLAPQKKKEEIIKPMSLITRQMKQHKEEKKIFKSSPSFVPAGQSTQLIVGATADHDYQILKLSEGLYNRFQLKRVYYSAYVPIGIHPQLPTLASPPTLREHRLYQADWLLRFYGFQATELLDEVQPNFDTLLDPKCDWALRNMHLFPIEINKAEIEMLLRIPGIGVQSARRIVAARRMAPISYDGLKKIGVVMKRARYFITCQGKYYGEVGLQERLIRQCLISKPILVQNKPEEKQLSLFDVYQLKESIITGEL
ncbi:putative DNA modification/repair radical SAM protein [Alkaliphilus peptidifermentans]|uniref:Putative DNA modification/repair radical SAM protein n=1 Tax=Alkaliphilus peptidifermentans DSM 18978 TaxID=1120976 RepID=A0A1G5ACL3_9FIRM|nr:putative DNA modification/repair radical SAM protein [Alkaliphilus peptidifermentans]SCX75602.1 putative DNA modification/repair radical SAM protein [Alkaliphilus peptidifermentans DSM 18978]